MAKQLVNPIERHVEKGVLGVTVLVLIGVIAFYLVLSPNRMELGGESVFPSTIDQKVNMRAADALERIRNASADEEMPEPLIGEFLEWLDPLKRAEVSISSPTVVAIGPAVPIIDAPETFAGQAELVKVVPTGEPKVVYGRSTYLTYTADAAEQHLPANWVTISVLFDVKQQMARQRRAYGPARKEVVFGPTSLQRRARRADGSWSDDDWADVQTWPAGRIPPIPSIPLLQEGDEIVVPRRDQVNIDEFLDRLREPQLQLDLLRPLPPNFVPQRGDEWKLAIITSRRDVLEQDDFYLFPEQPPATDPVDRYGGAEEEAVRVLVEELTSAQKLDEADRLLKSAWDNKSVNDALRAYNMAFEVKEDRDARSGDKNRANKLMAYAEQREKDIERWLLDPRHRRRSQLPGSGDEAGAVREPLPLQQLWVFDAEPESVESGRTYQYRLRPSIYNRLAGQPGKFRDPSDAGTVFILGEWTEPVEVAVEPATLFFVTSKDKGGRKVGVEFFQWFEGTWVKTREKFGVGQALAVTKRTEVTRSDTTQVDRPEVEFVANATVVDIDFDRSYRARKRGSRRSGVKFDRPSKSCCVVLADAAGRLHERCVPTDKSHPGKKEAAGRIKKRPRGRD